MYYKYLKIISTRQTSDLTSMLMITKLGGKYTKHTNIVISLFISNSKKYLFIYIVINLSPQKRENILIFLLQCELFIYRITSNHISIDTGLEQFSGPPS